MLLLLSSNFHQSTKLAKYPQNKCNFSSTRTREVVASCDRRDYAFVVTLTERFYISEKIIEIVELHPDKIVRVRANIASDSASLSTFVDSIQEKWIKLDTHNYVGKCDSGIITVDESKRCRNELAGMSTQNYGNTVPRGSNLAFKLQLVSVQSYSKLK